MKKIATVLLVMVFAFPAMAEDLTTQKSASEIVIADIVKGAIKIKPINTSQYFEVSNSYTSDNIASINSIAEGEIEGVQQGKIVLMGGAGINSSTSTSSNPFTPSNEFKENTLNVDFGAMYMLTQSIGILAALTVQTYSATANGNKDYSASLIGGRIGGRYYMPCFAPKFYTFAQLNLALAGGSRTNYDSQGVQSSKDKLSSFGFGLAPGFSYFMSRSIALEMSFGLLGWTQTKSTREEDSRFEEKDSQFDFLLNSKALTFGFCWWLGNN